MKCTENIENRIYLTTKEKNMHTQLLKIKINPLILQTHKHGSTQVIEC